MPRLLTIWLDLGETGEKKYLGKITDLMERSRKVQTYQFLTALPQIVSRITHSNPKVREALVRIVYRVVRDYPAQTLWLMVGPMLSKRKDRQSVAETILKKAVVSYILKRKLLTRFRAVPLIVPTSKHASRTRRSSRPSSSNWLRTSRTPRCARRRLAHGTATSRLRSRLP
jgi:serine/threonine-protein kinase ATR